MNGPATTRLRTELESETRRQGIVVWLDKDGHYAHFVDALALDDTLPFAVARYRDSFLELMQELEPYGDRTSKDRLLVHLPGFNEEDVKRSPLLELRLIGTRYLKALPTLIREAAHGLATPEQIAAVADTPGLTLEQADAWLNDLSRQPPTGIEAMLEPFSVPALLDELDRRGPIADAARRPGDRARLWRWLGTRLGVDDAWLLTLSPPATAPSPLQDADALRFGAASWALSVEYVHDLRRPPHEPFLDRLRGLPRPMVQACEELASHLRAAHPDSYRAVAMEIEALLPTERANMRPEDLGRIDTFSFEEETILRGAIEALTQQRYHDVLDQAEPRLAERSFWTSGPTAVRRRNAWALVQEAARLGQAIEAAGPSLEPGRAAFSTLDQAVQRYVQDGSPVDQAHRQLLQQRVARLDTQTPCAHTLRPAIDALRLAWRTWADRWSRDLCALYQRVGALPPEGLQQRTIFDQVVLPEVQRDRRSVAFFLIDALRYEMAAELAERLDRESDTAVLLRARLAELPSVTEVGMNALAPVTRDGRLSPRFDDRGFAGFSVGSFVVNSPATRRRAMADRVGASALPGLDLKQVLESTPEQLRAAAGKPLVVVHSELIDTVGEHGVGLRTWESLLGQLVDAWRRLREAGVKTFVITADHGFLLLDDMDPVAQVHGRTVDPRRRYVLSTAGVDHPDELRLRLADLGYSDDGGRHLMMPSTTAVFHTTGRPKDFAHGGPTLQERVIPVLTLSHKRAAGSTTDTFRVDGELLKAVGDMYRIRATVTFASHLSLAFAGRARVLLTLDSPDGDDVVAELIDGGQGCDIVPGGVQVTVESTFELFFRLTATAERKVRVRLGPGGTTVVDPWVTPERLLAPARPGLPGPPVPGPPVPAPTRSWLDELPPAWRPVFDHLDRFGDLGEDALARLLGSPRLARTFALEFDRLAATCPYTIEIRTTAAGKRYVRAGGDP